MNFAFDLELTLDAEPEAFRAICTSLITCGHGVYVVTGLFPGATEGYRLQQLAAIDFQKGREYTELRCCPGSSPAEVGDRKRDVCEEINAALMVDDRADFTERIRHSTRCLLILPKE